MTIERVRVITTSIALGGAVLHMIYPCLTIDSTTLGLLLIAFVPWLAPFLKSIELPGGLKVELQGIGERAKNAGMLASGELDSPKPAFSFQIVAESDPNLALAGLRIEIEKRLVLLAEANDIGPGNRGLGYLLRELNQRSILSAEERSVLADLISQLNSAVHGASVTKESLDWALEVGPKLLLSLEERISKKP